MNEEKNQEGQDRLQVYEVGFVLDPGLAESSVQDIFSGIKNEISERKGSFVSEEFPKRRELAYEIVKATQAGNKRFTQGYFGWVKFDLDASEIARIKEWLEKKAEIIRFLLIKTVRENTLIYQRVPFAGRTDGSPRREIPKAQEGAPAPAAVSEDELNKSIDKLIAE